MEKNLTVITPKGYAIKVAYHMLNDLLKHGCIRQKPEKKEPPEELKRPLKDIILTKSKVIEPLPVMEKTDNPAIVENPVTETSDTPDENDPIVSKVRKQPVRSRSKK
jgi:hypothetical protein